MTETPPTRGEVNEMAGWMAALGNIPESLAETANYKLPPPESNAVAPPPSMVSVGEIGEMKSIMEKINNASNNVLAEAPKDKSLREALVIKKTKYGARIGNWEIIVNENGKRKSYDVIHVETSEIIASQLLLYEAACGLARALNEGNFINSTDVLGLLHAEQDYANSVSDMILYKHHLTKNPNSNRAGIYETKYSEAKYKAVAAKGKVVKLSESF
jgi:hypothetical protein